MYDESKWDHDLRSFVKKCIALRKAHLALRRGSYHRLYSNEGVFAFGRWLGGEKFVIVFNVSKSTKSIDLPVSALQLNDGSLSDVWNTSKKVQMTGGLLHSLKLAPRRGIVLSV